MKFFDGKNVDLSPNRNPDITNKGYESWEGCCLTLSGLLADMKSVKKYLLVSWNLWLAEKSLFVLQPDRENPFGRM